MRVVTYARGYSFSRFRRTTGAGRRNTADDRSKTGWNGLAILERSPQTTSALTSLAQLRVAAHQEYQWRVFQSSLLSVAEKIYPLSACLYSACNSSRPGFPRFPP